MVSFIRGDVLLKAKRKIMDALRDVPTDQRDYVCGLALSELAEEEERIRREMLER